MPTFIGVRHALLSRGDLGASGKSLLARPTATVDTTKLGELANLANRLRFESTEISSLLGHPSSADAVGATGNN